MALSEGPQHGPGVADLDLEAAATEQGEGRAGGVEQYPVPVADSEGRQVVDSEEDNGLHGGPAFLRGIHGSGLMGLRSTVALPYYAVTVVPDYQPAINGRGVTMRWLLVLGVTLAGCSTGPSGSATPGLGTYRVTMVHSAPGFQPSTLRADLQITYADADSIAGQVAGLELMDTGPFTLGFRNGDAYRVDAGAFASTVAQLRLTFSDQGHTCTASLRYPDFRFEPLSCDLQ